MWQKAIKNAIETVSEMNRTIHGVLKHSVRHLYYWFDLCSEHDIITNIHYLTAEVSENLKISDFIIEIKTTTNLINEFLDAYYAHRPLSMNLLNFIVFNFHKTIRTKINRFWNSNWKHFNAGEIINFMNVIWFYDRIMQFWGINDENLSGWVGPLLRTFMTRLFENCRVILANILYETRNSYYTENGKIRSHISESLEGHLNMLFDHYKKVKIIESAELLLELCYNVLTVIFVNLKTFLRKDKFPLQIYIALINNSFIRVTRDFKKRVFECVEQKFTLKQFKEHFKPDVLTNMIVDIENRCFHHLLVYFRNQINIKFFTGLNFMELDFSHFLTTTLNEFMTLTNLIDNYLTVSNLYGKIFETITNCYYVLFLDYASKVTVDDTSLVLSKIEEDISRIGKAMEEHGVDEQEDIIFKLIQLKSFVASEDMDEVIVCIINMNVLYEGLISPENIDKLLGAKIFFPSACISYIKQYLNDSLYKFETKARTQSLLLSAFTINPSVNKFVINLSELKREVRGKTKRAC